MARQWTIKRGENEHGPISSQQLRNIAKSGKLNPTDLIRCGEDGDWQQASALAGLLSPIPHESVANNLIQAKPPIQASATTSPSTQSKVFDPASFKSDAKWLVLKSGKEFGPFSTQQMKSLADSGKLKPDNQVRRDETEVVYQASEIEGLFKTATENTDNSATLVITRKSKLTGFLSPVIVLVDGISHGSIGGGFPSGVLDLLVSSENSVNIPISSGQHRIDVAGGGLKGSTTIVIGQGQTHRLGTYFSNLGKIGGGLRLDPIEGGVPAPVVAAEPSQPTSKDWTTKGVVKLSVVCLGLFMMCSGAMRGMGSAAKDRSSSSLQEQAWAGRAEDRANTNSLSPTLIADERLALHRSGELTAVPSNAVLLQDRAIDETFSPSQAGLERLEDKFILHGGTFLRILSDTKNIRSTSYNIIESSIVRSFTHESKLGPAVKEDTNWSGEYATKNRKRVRVNDGFIQTADDKNGDDLLKNKAFWEPILKLGAKSGESWQRKVSDAIDETYTLKSVFKWNGEVYAVVEENSVIGSMRSRTTTWYQQHQGVVRCETWIADDNAPLSWKHSGITVPQN